MIMLILTRKLERINSASALPTVPGATHINSALGPEPSQTLTVARVVGGAWLYEKGWGNFPLPRFVLFFGAFGVAQ